MRENELNDILSDSNRSPYSGEEGSWVITPASTVRGSVSQFEAPCCHITPQHHRAVTLGSNSLDILTTASIPPLRRRHDFKLIALAYE